MRWQGLNISLSAQTNPLSKGHMKMPTRSQPPEIQHYPPRLVAPLGSRWRVGVNGCAATDKHPHAEPIIDSHQHMDTRPPDGHC